MSPKISFRCGFTLIEILIVILIIAIVSGIVAPVAYKGVGKFDNLISRSRIANIKKGVSFLSFITDSRCRYDNKTIICGKHKYVLK